MRGRCYSLFGLFLVVILFAGCSKQMSWPWPGASVLAKRERLVGPIPLIDRKFETVDLIPLLDSTVNTNMEYEGRLRKAYDNFYNAQDVERRRNRVQERIIAASNQRCGEYKKFVKNFDAETNIGLGWLTTAAGGAGAIVTAEAVARALSGVAAIMSGFRAELNEAYFHNLTIQVLTDGMEKKRQEIYRKIRENQKENVTDYPVEKAIGDAIFYHDHCSLIAGLEFSAASVQRANDPGLNEINQTLRTLEQTQRQMNRVAALNTSSPQVVLPLSAFYAAQEAANKLERGHVKLQRLAVPEIGDVKRKKEELEQDVKNHLDGWKKTELSETERKKVENIQTALQTAQAQLYASVTANDLAKIEGVKSALRVKQDEAREKSLQYEKLTDKIQARVDEVKSFIESVE